MCMYTRTRWIKGIREKGFHNVFVQKIARERDPTVRNLKRMSVEELLFVPQVQNEWRIKNSNASERTDRETAE